MQTRVFQFPKNNEPPRVLRRNVRIDGRRTTVKMETQMWDALEQICAETDASVDSICSALAAMPQARTNLTSLLRLFILDYFRDRAARTADTKS